MAIQQKITPHLWFDNNAEEAVAFHTSIFTDARVVTRSRYGESGPGPKGWLAGGDQESQCGWLKDRFGLSWQIDYAGLQDMMGDAHPDRADRVMKAMLAMKKIDILHLKDAYEGRQGPAASRASETTRWRARILQPPPGP